MQRVDSYDYPAIQGEVRRLSSSQRDSTEIHAMRDSDYEQITPRVLVSGTVIELV